MPRQDYTDITFVLDRSGSMKDCLEGTISGFNSMLEEQRNLPGKCLVSLVQFDDEYIVSYAGVPISTVPKLNSPECPFVPRNATALLGAIGLTVDNLGARLNAMQEENRPGKVILCILTDGLENFSPRCDWSKAYTVPVVSSKLKTQQNVYSWNVIFLGANQDAILTAKTYGIDHTSTVNYQNTNKGSEVGFRAISKGMSDIRSNAVGGKLANLYKGALSADAVVNQMEEEEKAKKSLQPVGV